MPLEKLISIHDVNNSIAILSSIFDSARIIRPKKKKTIILIDGQMIETQGNCYDIWSTGKVCENCVSMRALNEKDIFFKLEWANKNIFMVIAIPVQDEAETLVLELLKDITDSMTVEPLESINDHAILHALYETGQLQVRDSLTGIYNRRFINERLPSDILNASSGSTPLSVIFADIDHFKIVNDTHGHLAGDYILKKFAELLQKNAADRNGWSARYGGEEFLLVIKDELAASVIEFTEKLREEIENTEFNYEGNSIRITSSFGVFSLNKSYDIKAEDLIDHADKNLYAAKTSGRNKVVSSEL